ncbi:MAG: sulfatase [Acidobacteria bacterium]|nr:sulfatase [Acidobacteriota bacterium]
MLLRTVLSILSVTLSVALCGCGAGRRPNILLVVIDTARGDRFSFNGYDRPTSPVLDALARDGAIYTRAYSPAPWTVPAHASLFTGQYPSRHRTDCGSLRLPDEIVTLAEILQDAGYRTVGYTANPWIGSSYNFQQGFDKYIEIWREVNTDVEPDTGAARINSRVLRYLRWWAENPDARSRPFFVFINYFEPHLGYHPPEPERSRFLREGVDRARAEHLSRLGHPDEMEYILGRSDLTAGDMEILNDLYDGEIAYIDRRLGEIFDLLRELDLLDETIIAVTGDHGENIGDHGMMDHKMSVHDSLLHVPLVMRYPARIGPGQRIDDVVQMHDLFPTLLGLIGIDPPEGVRVEAVPLPGTSVDGPVRAAGDPIVGEFVGPPVEFIKTMQELFPGVDVSRFDRTLVALRSGDLKIHWGSDGRHQLFNVVDDPGELRDLAAAGDERLDDMVQRVERWLRRPARRDR